MFHADTENSEELLPCMLQQDEYLLETCFAAFGHDSLKSSRPICSPAETPTQIEQMFDTISYEKVCKTILYGHLNHCSFLMLLHRTKEQMSKEIFFSDK